MRGLSARLYGSIFVVNSWIIPGDADGFGLTVTGDNPVFVQTVKDDGAAARAGVRQGDRIMKVNGTLVTGANHLEVVRMISCGTYVALTLLGKAPQGESLSSMGFNDHVTPVSRRRPRASPPSRIELRSPPPSVSFRDSVFLRKICDSF